VRHARDWPGLTTYHLEYGVPKVIKKPDVFFSDDMPDELTITLKRPEDVRPDLSDRELRRHIRAEVKKLEYEARDKLRAEGRTFMGVGRILRQPRHNSPKRRDIRKGIRPHVAAANKWVRIEALRQLKQFWRDHERARLSDRDGGEPLYPTGTYRARLLGRPCAQAP